MTHKCMVEWGGRGEGVKGDVGGGEGCGGGWTDLRKLKESNVIRKVTHGAKITFQVLKKKIDDDGESEV